MADFHKEGRILVTCSKGMPPFLRQELASIGYATTESMEAAVACAGSLADCMRMNMHLRTAHRVLYLISESTPSDARAMYAWISSLPWPDYVTPDGYVTVRESVDNETIRDTRYAALKCKDAIVDRIRAEYGARPDAGPAASGTVLFLFWRGDYAAIYLDTSGIPLTRRGYRRLPWKAPMSETLAAGVLAAAGWNGSCPLVNPMCGSGTIAIEAALIATGTAPGLLRDEFSFIKVPGFRRDEWKKVRADARLRVKPWSGRIIATDIDPRAVNAARKNAAAAGMNAFLEFSVCDFRETTIPGAPCMVVINPEYGERMGSERELEPVYRAMGDFFKQRCQGCRGFVFTGNLSLAKTIGLRSKRRIPFFNSRIECRLLEFEIYAGTRRRFERDDNP